MDNWKTAVGFVAALGSLTTLMIPALSVLLAITALVFFWLAPRDANKGIRLSTLGMASMALIADLIYFLLS